MLSCMAKYYSSEETPTPFMKLDHFSIYLTSSLAFHFKGLHHEVMGKRGKLGSCPLLQKRAR